MTPAAPGRVVVVGDANPDLVLRGDVVPRFGQIEQLVAAADLVLGGSGGIAASGLARLGVPTSIVAAIGDDAFGRDTVSRLEGAGVAVDALEVRADAPTGLTVHLVVPGDRAMLTLPGAIPALAPDVVRAAITRIDPAHVHVASPFLTPAVLAALPGLLAEWRAAGRTTSLDTNWDPAEAWAGIREALPHVDVLLPNRAELAAIAQACDPGTADPAATIAALGPRVVVKDGAEGGWSLDGRGVRHAATGLRVEVVDTTGAGDGFDAGYLAALVHGVEDEAVRLRWATVAGSLSTRGAGGTAAQATLDELRAAL